MTRVIIVRHGQSTANLDKVLAGQSNVQLTDLGHLQAEAVATYLLQRENITAVYSSDLDRAYNTALPTASALGIPIVKDKRLREIDLGLFVGHNLEEMEKVFPKFFEDHPISPSLKVYPGGECAAQAYDRMKECICEIAEKHHGQTVLIASHGGAMKTFFAYVLGYSRLETFNAPPVANTAISIFEWNGEKMDPVVINSTEHLNDIETHIEKD